MAEMAWKDWLNFVICAKHFELENGRNRRGRESNERHAKKIEMCKRYNVDVRWFNRYKDDLKTAISIINENVPVAPAVPDITLDVISLSVSTASEISFVSTARSTISTGERRLPPQGWDFSHMYRQDINALIDTVHSSKQTNIKYAAAMTNTTLFL